VRGALSNERPYREQEQLRGSAVEPTLDREAAPAYHRHQFWGHPGAADDLYPDGVAGGPGTS